MSLPFFYKTTRETVPAEIPYLEADPNLVSHWHNTLNNDHNFKVGIVWEGSPYYESFKTSLSKKSIPLELFAPLAALPGVSLYSLQQMNGTDQLKNLPSGMLIHTFGDDFDSTNGRFMDTAAVIKNMDLILCVDTSVAHLAGALGAPVWMLVPLVADWRWMEQQSDSPWYPTMRIFRQTACGDWTTVMDTVINELSTLIKKPAQAIMTEVAIGELVDKITILEIKKQEIKDKAKLRNVEQELTVLNNTFGEHFSITDQVADLKTNLLRTNKKLWDIEDAIRDKERAKNFDQEFIELARSVYITNDQRCLIKRRINELLGSHLKEEKSYAAY